MSLFLLQPVSTVLHVLSPKSICKHTLRIEVKVILTGKVFSPGAWQRSEVDVALSAAGRGSDHRPESVSLSSAPRDEKTLTYESKGIAFTSI